MKAEIRDLYNVAAKIYLRHCAKLEPAETQELPTLVRMVSCIVSEYTCYCNRERNCIGVQIEAVNA